MICTGCDRLIIADAVMAVVYVGFNNVSDWPPSHFTGVAWHLECAPRNEIRAAGEKIKSRRVSGVESPSDAER